MGRGTLGAIVAGAVAGAVGTLAMDLVWFSRYRRGGGEDGFVDWEFATGTESFDTAGAPAQVGKRVAEAVGVELPDRAAATTTNVMHWITGVGYGIAHGLAYRDGGGPPTPIAGVLTGTGAYLNSYATLGAMGVYEPMWEYDGETLFKDWTAHTVFGLGTALAYRALRGGDDA